MRLAVCDTGPILHLIEAGLLGLLQNVGEVYIPKSVDSEMSDLHHYWEKERPDWIQIEPLRPNEAEKAESLFLSGLLDAGEAEAIILAKRLNAEWFLTDDTEARIFANSLGIEVHGSLGIVLWAAAAGYLSYNESNDALDRLSKTSLWISKDILSQAHMALKTMFQKE